MIIDAVLNSSKMSPKTIGRQGKMLKMKIEIIMFPSGLKKLFWCISFGLLVHSWAAQKRAPSKIFFQN